MEWQDARTAPEGKIVMTKIDDERGCRNEQLLKRSGRMWFFPDGEGYVYYTPTHFMPATASQMLDIAHRAEKKAQELLDRACSYRSFGAP